MNRQARLRGTTLIELSVVIAVCPKGVAYVFTGTIPPQGVAYASCPVPGNTPSPTVLAAGNL
jgi:hypothetical protein